MSLAGLPFVGETRFWKSLRKRRGIMSRKIAATKAVKSPVPAQGTTPEERERMIAEAAYFMAEKRNFSGDAVADWLEAEAKIDQWTRF